VTILQSWYVTGDFFIFKLHINKHSMLSISFIREQRDQLIERLKVKNFHRYEIIDAIISEDNERRTLQVKQDNLQAELNAISKEIGTLYKEGKKAAAEKAKEATVHLKEKIKELQQSLHKTIFTLQELLVLVPNIPHESVPHGKGEADNEKMREGGKLPVPAADAVPHWDLISRYDIIDFELGNKLTGAGFPVYKGQGGKAAKSPDQFFPG